MVVNIIVISSKPSQLCRHIFFDFIIFFFDFSI